MTVQLILLILANAAAGACVAAAVRLHLALHRGFDFLIAAMVTISAEIYALVATTQGTPSVVNHMAAATMGCLAAALLNLTWFACWRRVNVSVDKLPHIVLLASLGITSIFSGLVGWLRGPGLSEPFGGTPWAIQLSTGGLSAGQIWMAGGGALVAVVGIRWLRGHTGLGLDLLAQEPTLSREVGVDTVGLMGRGAAASALLCGLVGNYAALVGGSTPDVGSGYFLYGACGALLLRRRSILLSAAGGAMLGTVRASTQLFFDPVEADFGIFAAIAVVLVVAGEARFRQDIR